MSSINAKVPPLRLFAVDTPSDGQLPSYQSSSGEFEWVDDSTGGGPGGSNDEIQYNNSGAFGGDAGLKMITKGAGATTVIQSGNILAGGNKIATGTANGTINIICDGSGQIILSSGNDQGGTFADSIVNIMANANTDDAQLKFRDSSNTDNGSITLDGSGDLVLNNNVANKDIDLKVLGTGIAEVANQTTDNDTTFSIKGNGTGDSVLQLTNASESVSVLCDTNNKLKVKGGVHSFVFDVSSGSGGITFPDSTVQTTAASGGSTYGYVTIDPTIPTDGGTRTYSQSVPGSAPYWGKDAAGTGGYAWDEPFFWPFIASHTGNVASLSIDVATAGVSTEWYVGIYDVDSDGLPDNLLGKAVMDMSSTGVVTQSSLSATISLTKGTMYYWSYVKKTGATAQTWRLSNPPLLGLSSDSSGPSDVGNCLYYDDATNDLPAAPTPANFEQAARTDPTVGAIAW